MKVTNLAYGDSDKSFITATVTDNSGTTRECALQDYGAKHWLTPVYRAVIAGEYGEIAPYEPPVVDYTPSIKGECSRRIYAVGGKETQMNLAARRASGKLTAAEELVYAELIDWIDNMVQTCRAMINIGDADFADDAKWPQVTDGGVDLCSRY